MKNHLLLIIVISLICFTLVDQAVPQDTLWTKRYGGVGWQEAFDISITNDGGYLLVGWSDSGYPGWDAYLVKSDGLGDSITATYIGGEGNQKLTSIHRNNSGFISFGFAPGSNGGIDFWLLSIGENGDSLWSRTYGGADNDYGRIMATTDDGGYILAGETRSFGAGELDWYVVKTDSDGDTLWTGTYGWSGEDWLSDIQQTSDGGYLIAGFSDLNDQGRAYLVKTNSQGAVIWYKLEYDGYYKWFTSAMQTMDGGYIAAGFTEVWNGWNYYEEIYMVKYDSEGNKEWTQQHDNPPFFTSRGMDLLQAPDGGFLMVGRTSYMSGNTAGYVLRTDAQGEKQWSKTLYVPGSTRTLKSIKRVAYNEYAAVGNIDQDMWLVKLSEPLVCCGVLMIPDDDPITVQPGGSFRYRGIVSNSQTEPLPTDVWTGVIYEGEFFLLHRFPRIESLQPGEVIMRRLIQNVPYYAPAGDYQYVSYCGIYPEACDSFKFDFTVTGAPLADRNTEWSVMETTVGAGAPTGGENINLPTTLHLDGSPNPFNASTRIDYLLSEDGHAKLEIFDIMGKRVDILIDGYK
ncbi:MAG: hypothetical protein GF315_12360, partial [candidate division Zixibacteria bacterium]|nr:hypothetical protein [candidate division Zixibacteria bacterium]